MGEGFGGSGGFGWVLGGGGVRVLFLLRFRIIGFGKGFRLGGRKMVEFGSGGGGKFGGGSVFLDFLFDEFFFFIRGGRWRLSCGVGIVMVILFLVVGGIGVLVDEGGFRGSSWCGIFLRI